MTVTQNAGKCTIAARDAGIGIAPEVLPHVFERFYRVPGVEVLTDSSVGFGVGLYISQQIAEHHGGHIEVQSVPESESVFSIVLPLRVSDAVDTALEHR